MNFIRKYFQLDKYNTSIKVEFIAGLTTFISMSYILFVNPSVLGASGMNTGAVFTATALASALGSAIMGIVANYPIGEAPALGINAFFAYTVSCGDARFMANCFSQCFRCINYLHFDHFI